MVVSSPQCGEKYSLFLLFSPWREPRLRYFSDYPFGTSMKKAPTVFYNTAFFIWLYHSTRLFCFSNILKIYTFSLIFPLVGSVIGGFYWLFLWNFKEIKYQPFSMTQPFIFTIYWNYRFLSVFSLADSIAVVLCRWSLWNLKKASTVYSNTDWCFWLYYRKRLMLSWSSKGITNKISQP